MESSFLRDIYTVTFSNLKVRAIDIQGAKLFDSHSPNALLNGVFHMEHGHEKFENQLAIINAHFQKVERPYSLWIKGKSLSSNEKRLLEEKGLHLWGECVAAVHKLEQLQQKTSLDGFEIVPVKEMEEFKKWERPFHEAFQFTQSATEHYLKLQAKAGFQAPFTHLSGVIEGEVVNTGTLLTTDQGGYLFNLTTLPTTRRRGFGKEMILHRLELAKQKGCKRVGAILSPQVALLHQSLGFEYVYSYSLFVTP